MQALIEYLTRILPGMLLIVLTFILLKPGPYLRIVYYVFIFVFLRIALTPLGLWQLGETHGLLWIRLSSNPVFLILFGLSSLIITTGLWLFDRENRNTLIWMRGKALPGLISGTAGCALVVLPFISLYPGIPLAERGGAVGSELLLPLLVFALLGNLFEETLFRGYVLGFLSKTRNLTVAGIVSGVVFALCHSFLATTVTDIGIPLLLFTLWEGVIAGLVGARHGILPAALTHGGAIFMLSSGLI
ncbi:MAG: CPBP family glutamic-type intramembrane protease [candidate division KSB1 bacterium]|nr:CPBP family glutamic-type intramembrane protease [candidate division KSB1 bacterium]